MIIICSILGWYLLGLAAVAFSCRAFLKEMDRREIKTGLLISLFGPFLWILIGIDKLCDIWGDENDKDYKQ